MLTLEPLVVEAYSRVSGTAADIIVLALHVALPLLLASVALVRARRSAARGALADASSRSTSEPLVAGVGVVAHGVVELAPDVKEAMTVSIMQEGKEQRSKKGERVVSHTWTEVSRKTAVAPFVLVDDRGQKIRVEPNEEALLVDRLDHTTVHGKRPARRTRHARIVDGERVWVVGDLISVGRSDAGAYRDAPAELVLRAPPSGRMLLSTEPLGERFRAESATHRFAGKAFVALALLLGLLDLGYHACRWAGRPSTAVAVEVKRLSGKNPRCELTLEPNAGDAFTDQVELRYCSKVKKGDVVAIVDPGGVFRQAGKAAGVNLTVGIFGLVFAVATAGLYSVRRRPWYEAKLVDHGAGPLICSDVEA